MPPLNLSFDWEEAAGAVTLRQIRDARRSAHDFNDLPARLTPRQAAFYRNLVRMAEQLQSSRLPIDVIPRGERQLRTLDAGCIKIAEHAGFIRQLRDGPSGRVEELELSWNAALP